MVKPIVRKRDCKRYSLLPKLRVTSSKFPVCFCYCRKYVRLGEFNVRTEPDCIEEPNYLSCADAAMDMSVEKITVHPDYKDYSFNKLDDIAVIRLKNPVSFTHFVMPICLPNRTEDSPFEKDQMFSVSGWGRTDFCE